MSPLTVGIIGIVVLFLLFASRLPIGFAMALVGFLGFTYLSSLGSGLVILGISTTTAAASRWRAGLPCC